MTKEPEIPDTECQDTKPTYPTLNIDWDLFGSMLEDSDLSEGEQREMIEVLANIVFAFVDLGFGIHPTQQACEQQADLSQAIDRYVLQSNPILADTTDDMKSLGDDTEASNNDSRKETP